jgi:hypothetical protein
VAIGVDSAVIAIDSAAVAIDSAPVALDSVSDRRAGKISLLNCSLP